MDPRLTSQPVRVPTRDNDEDGLLISVDGRLVALFTHLDGSVSEEFRNRWFLEAGFGSCSVRPEPAFDSAQEAQQWVLDQVSL